MKDMSDTEAQAKYKSGFKSGPFFQKPAAQPELNFVQGHQPTVVQNLGAVVGGTSSEPKASKK